MASEREEHIVNARNVKKVIVTTVISLDDEGIEDVIKAHFNVPATATVEWGCGQLPSLIIRYHEEIRKDG